jgi:hypothetical protein
MAFTLSMSAVSGCAPGRGGAAARLGGGDNAGRVHKASKTAPLGLGRLLAPPLTHAPRRARRRAQERARRAGTPLVPALRRRCGAPARSAPR